MLFIWSITYTDILSGWTANRAVWNKGSAGIVESTREVEAKLPFDVLGFDCDNGSEFLNWHLVRYFQERRRPVGFTRSRRYHKDDNGHVELKNWTRVRQLLGYGRLEEPSLLPAIHEIYREIWDPLQNFFMPSAKLVSKNRHGAKIQRCHDIPRTPCDRLLECGEILAARKKNSAESGRRLIRSYARKTRADTGARTPDGASLQSPNGLLAFHARWSMIV